jgi:hypothetical protein
VQYGAYWVPRLFEIARMRQNPGWLNLSYVDAPGFDRGMIESIYDFLIEECDQAYKLANGLDHSQ